MKGDTMAIRLGFGQSAEPNTCGSCKYYRFNENTSRGNCNFKMPPWIKLAHTHASLDVEAYRGTAEIFENSSDPTMVYDNQSCSFWTPSGLTYVQDRTWTVKE